MAKVAIDIRMLSFRPHGIGRYIKNLLQQFSVISKNYSFVLLYDKDKTPLNLTDPRFFFREISSSKFSFKEQLEIPLVLKKLSPILFHAPSIATPFFQPCPVVITIHDLIPFIFPDYYPKYKLLYLPILKAAAKKARLILVPSQSTKCDVNKILKVPLEKIQVTPYGIEEMFCSEAIQGEEKIVRKRFNLSENFFLTLVNFRPHKNLFRLLKAFSLLKERNCQLVVAGETDSKSYKWAKELNLEKRVSFLGYIPDEVLLSLYRTALAFVFPSLYEGFGLPVLEAMACGTPVICSNSSSLPEIVGEDGLLVDPKNLDQIAAAMKRVLQDSCLREELSTRALRKAADFTWQKTAELTLKAYKEAIG